MFTNLRLRSRESLDDLCTAFDEYTCSERLALNEMAHRALANTNTASSPIVHRASASEVGLRGREGIADGMMMMERPFTPPDDGGNVKVVVRVRKFIKRGLLMRIQWQS